MVTLNYPGQVNAPTSFLNNRIVAPTTLSDAMNQDSMQIRSDDAARDVFNAQYDEHAGENLATRLAKFGAAGVIDSVDTVASVLPNLQRGDIWSALKASPQLHMDGLADWQARNKSGVEMASGLLTALTGDWVADSVILGSATRVLLSSSALQNSRLLMSGVEMMPKARAVAKASMLDTASAGQMTTLMTPGIKGLLSAHIAKNVGKAALSEGVIAAIGHNNEAIWSDSNAQNAFWFGLGLAIPGAAGLIQGRAEVRAMANSPEVLETRRVALDPNDFRAMRDKLADPTVPYNPDTQFKESSQVMSAALEAAEKIPDNLPPGLESKLRAQALQSRIALQTATAKFAAKGIPDLQNQAASRVISFSKTSAEDAGMRDHVMEAQKNDPMLMWEAQSIGTGKPLQIDGSRKAQIKFYESTQDPKDYAKAQELKKEQGFVLLGGRLYPINKDTDALFNFDPASVKLTPTSRIPGMYDYNLTMSSGKKIRLDPSVNIQGFSKMPIEDRMSIVEGLTQISKNMTGPIKTRPTMVVKPGSNWLQLETAAYHMNRQGNVDLSRVAYKNVNDLQFAALQDKIKDMKLNGDFKQELDQMTRLKYNLPPATALERIEDGSSKVLNSVLESVDNGQLKTMDQVRAAYQMGLERHDLTAVVNTATPFEGQMWQFNRDKHGKWFDPVVMYYKDQSQNLLERGTRDLHVTTMTNNKLVRYHALTTGTNPDSIVGQVARFATESPEGARATQIGGMSDDTITGTGPGAAAELGAALPNSFRDRDNEILQATNRLGTIGDTLADKLTQRQIIALGDVPQRLASSANKKSQVLHDAFNSFRPGWDLKENSWRQGSDGMWRVMLDENSEWNRERARMAGLPAPVKGSILKNHVTGQDLVLDDLGYEAHQAMQGLFNNFRKEENKIRVAMGLTPIRYTPDWVPSTSLEGKFVAFVIDGESGKVIGGKTIIEDSLDKFNTRMEEVQKALPTKQYLHTQEEIAASQDLYDQAQMHWVDAAFAGRKNVSGRAGTVGNVVKQDTMGEQLRYIQRKNTHLAQGTLRTLFEDQIQIAKMRRAVDRGVYGKQFEFSEGKSTLKHAPNTVWDDYLKTLVGPALGEVVPRATTQILNAGENLAQKYLTSGWYAMRQMPTEQVSNWVRDFASRLGIKAPTHVKTFDQLTQELGPYMPYATMDDYVSQVVKGGKPPEIQKITAALNRWDATWRLRYFELPNAAMNMLGLIDNMPSLLNTRAPLIGQLVAGNNNRVGVINSLKLVTEGMAAYFTKRFAPDLNFAARHGGLDQGVAELRDTMAGIEDRKSWRRVMFGDKSLKNGSSIGDKIRYHGIDGILAYANDSTERWSRGLAHTVGLTIADYRGITGELERFNFANAFANSAIADYSPRNRGELYQTAFGSLMGLYQTYAMSYASRMYRWAEQGDYRAIMRQVAMQSLLFGAKSNVGYNALEWLEDKVTGDEATISDMIYARFGPLVGSAIAHGGISDISRLFGADTGIALYQRADSNIRTNILADGVFMDPMKISPALGTLKDMGKGMLEMGSEMLGAVTGNRIASAQHISEVMATHMPNRMLRGLMAVAFNGGRDIDNYGAVASESKGFFESAVRALGLRTTRQQDELDFKYANQASLDRNAARSESFREDIRSLERSGKLQDNLTQVFHRYTELGMDPQQFGSFIRQQTSAATTTRGLRELQKALNNPRTQSYVARAGWTD